MTQASLEALKNTLLASAQSGRITASKHRQFEQALIDELYDVQSRGDLLYGLTTQIAYSSSDLILSFRAGVARLLPVNLIGGGGGGGSVTLTGDITGSGSGSVATTIRANINLPGSPTSTTQPPGTNNTTLATTAYVDGLSLPAFDGTHDGYVANAGVDYKFLYSDGTWLTPGTTNYVLTSNGTSAKPTWKAASGGFADPLTTDGDIIARISGATTRLAKGGNGTFLGVSGGVLGYYTPAGGGSGTVTSVSVTTANGVSGTVATSTTTPAISLTLGAITPTSVNGVTISGSGTWTFPNVTGTVARIDAAQTFTGLQSFTTLPKLGGTGSSTTGFIPTAIDANGGWTWQAAQSQILGDLYTDSFSSLAAYTAVGSPTTSVSSGLTISGGNGTANIYIYRTGVYSSLDTRYHKIRFTVTVNSTTLGAWVGFTPFNSYGQSQRTYCVMDNSATGTRGTLYIRGDIGSGTDALLATSSSVLTYTNGDVIEMSYTYTAGQSEATIRNITTNSQTVRVFFQGATSYMVSAYGGNIVGSPAIGTFGGTQVISLDTYGSAARKNPILLRTGDSVTAGAFNSPLLREVNLTSLNVQGSQVVYAAGGDGPPDVINGFNEIIQIAPKYMTIDLGINPAGNSIAVGNTTTSGTFIYQINQIINLCIANNIIPILLYTTPVGSGAQTTIDSYNAALTSNWGGKYLIVDYATALKSGGATVDAQYVVADLVHKNAKGYSLMNKLLVEGIKNEIYLARPSPYQTLPGESIITSNAVNQINYSGVWTATTATDYHANYGGTLTSTIAGGARGYVFSPSMIAAGTGSVQFAVDINPTFSGGTAAVNVALRVGKTGGVTLFGADSGTPLNAELIQLRRDANNGTYMLSGNASTGTSAAAGYSVTNSSTFSTYGYFLITGTGWNPTAIYTADTVVISSTATGGLSMGTTANQQTSLWSNSIKRLAISANGGIAFTPSGASSLWIPALAITPGAHLSLVAATEYNITSIAAVTLSWNGGGTWTTSHFNVRNAPTMAFSSATTVPRATNYYFKKPLQGTSATITTSYGIETEGIYISNGNFTYVDGNQALNKVLTSDANGVATWQTSAGGGITNSAANTELMMSNGTNATPSGLFVPSATNLNLGSASITGDRTIQAINTAATANLFLKSGATISLTPGSGSTFSVSDFASGAALLYSPGSGTLQGVKTSTGVFGLSIAAPIGISSSVNGDSLKLYGGAAYSVGNNNGGNIYLKGGALNGTGVVGNVMIGNDTGTPNATLDVQGGVCFASRTITAAPTIATTDFTLLCDTSSGTIAVTLPTPGSTNTGRILIFKKTSASNSLTVATVDGGTKTYTTQYTGCIVQSNGTVWSLISIIQ